MRKYGWCKGFPMIVVRNGDGRYQIKIGHHRFYIAKKLGIPVRFIVCDDDKIPVHLYEATTRLWDNNDFAYSYANEGRESYVAVKEYHEDTGIGLQNCIAMLGGESAGSANKTDLFKSGDYKVVDDTIHADIVAHIVLKMRMCGIDWATNSNLVKAISKVIWVEEFDIAGFIHKIKAHSYLIEKKPSVVDYIEMIEAIYNCHRRVSEKIPLTFLAEKAALSRTPIGKKKQD